MSLVYQDPFIVPVILRPLDYFRNLKLCASDPCTQSPRSPPWILPRDVSTLPGPSLYLVMPKGPETRYTHNRAKPRIIRRTISRVGSLRRDRSFEHSEGNDGAIWLVRRR